MSSTTSSNSKKSSGHTSRIPVSSKDGTSTRTRTRSKKTHPNANSRTSTSQDAETCAALAEVRTPEYYATFSEILIGPAPDPTTPLSIPPPPRSTLSLSPSTSNYRQYASSIPNLNKKPPPHNQPKVSLSPSDIHALRRRIKALNRLVKLEISLLAAQYANIRDFFGSVGFVMTRGLGVGVLIKAPDPVGVADWRMLVRCLYTVFVREGVLGMLDLGVSLVERSGGLERGGIGEDGEMKDFGSEDVDEDEDVEIENFDDVEFSIEELEAMETDGLDVDEDEHSLPPHNTPTPTDPADLSDLPDYEDFDWSDSDSSSTVSASSVFANPPTSNGDNAENHAPQGEERKSRECVVYLFRRAEKN